MSSFLHSSPPLTRLNLNLGDSCVFDVEGILPSLYYMHSYNDRKVLQWNSIIRYTLEY